MSGLLCAGNLYIDRFDANGNPTGLRFWGNATKCALTEAADIKTRVSKQKASYGQAADIVPIKKPTGLDITLDEVNKDTVSAGLLGTTADLTVTAGTVTAEPVTAHLGNFVKTAHENISNLVVHAASSTPSTPYVAGTDYNLVDASSGMIQIISGGAITDGEALTLAYSYAADAGTGVTGGAQPSINCRVLLDGKNLATGQPILLDIPSAVIAPKSAVDFLADNFVPIDLSGQVKGTYSFKLKAQASS